MLEQLIQQITQRVGINASQAQGAISVVVGFIRQRVPALAPYLGMLDGGNTGLSSGTPTGTAATPSPSSTDEGGLNNILGNISGMFGGQQRQELQGELQQKANLDQQQSNGVIDTVQQFLSQQMGGLGNLGGNSGTQQANAAGDGGLLGQAEGMLGGLFGDKKNN